MFFTCKGRTTNSFSSRREDLEEEEKEEKEEKEEAIESVSLLNLGDVLEKQIFDAIYW